MYYCQCLFIRDTRVWERPSQVVTHSGCDAHRVRPSQPPAASTHSGNSGNLSQRNTIDCFDFSQNLVSFCYFHALKSADWFTLINFSISVLTSLSVLRYLRHYQDVHYCNFGLNYCCGMEFLHSLLNFTLASDDHTVIKVHSWCS